jgi:MFS family permease
MIRFSPPVISSFLTPALALMLLFGALGQLLGLNPRGWKWCLGLALASFGLLLIPVGGLPLARWLAGIADHWSIPLTALLLSNFGHRFLGIELLRHQDRQAAGIFGVVAGVVLYPLALGLGPVDPFSLGWYFGPLFAGMAVVTAFLLWKGNRFGVVLVLAISAWQLGVPESANYWDCLVDPIYFLVSLYILRPGGGWRRPRETQSYPR